MKAILFTSLLMCVLSASGNEVSRDTINKKALRTVIITESAFYLGGNAFLQWVWYKDHKRVPFHFYNDNKGYLQVDKFGHAYGAYQYSRKGYEALRWAGVGKRKALIYGAPLGLILQTPIEIFDGIYEGYGFSNGDMIANASGTLLFMLQESIFNKQTAKLKFSYSPSEFSKYNPYNLGETHIERFFLDYNGHTYWMSINLSDLMPKVKLPKYLNLALGYSANGLLGEFENPSRVDGVAIPNIPRVRQYLFSLDIDLSRIKTKSKFLKSLFSQLNTLKIPFPAIEYNRLESIQFRPLYF
ncbi:MAG: DUF2279 domain-containing protein [Bacteroidia bacterium]